MYKNVYCPRRNFRILNHKNTPSLNKTYDNLNFLNNKLLLQTENYKLIEENQKTKNMIELEEKKHNILVEKLKQEKKLIQEKYELEMQREENKKNELIAKKQKIYEENKNKIQSDYHNIKNALILSTKEQEIQLEDEKYQRKIEREIKKNNYNQEKCDLELDMRKFNIEYVEQMNEIEKEKIKQDETLKILQLNQEKEVELCKIMFEKKKFDLQINNRIILDNKIFELINKEMDENKPPEEIKRSICGILSFLDNDIGPQF